MDRSPQGPRNNLPRLVPQKEPLAGAYQHHKNSKKAAKLPANPMPGWCVRPQETKKAAFWAAFWLVTKGAGQTRLRAYRWKPLRTTRLCFIPGRAVAFAKRQNR